MAYNITASLVLKIIFTYSIFLGLQVTDNVFLLLLFSNNIGYCMLQVSGPFTRTTEFRTNINGGFRFAKKGLWPARVSRKSRKLCEPVKPFLVLIYI